MTDKPRTNRRTVLKTAGGLIAGTTLLARPGAARDRQAGLPSMIESHGHYTWFPLGPESWGRAAEPYDMQDGDSRWLAQPTDEGGVRVLAENLGTEPPNRNTGFDVHLGRLGTIESVSVTSRTLQTPRTTGPAALYLALYLDKDANAEFFEWESTSGSEQWAGFGGDDEGLTASAASGEVTIAGDTTFAVVNAETEATLAELQEGTVKGISGETAAGLYIGVANSGEGTDEVVVEDVSVQRS